MDKLRCIIVDDEPLAVKMLEGFVERTPYLELAGSFTDPVLALSAIKDTSPELVFLDIQMPDLDGMELSRMIPARTKIVFTTAFKQYAFESYEVAALDFLLKPIRYQKFLAAAERARQWFDRAGMPDQVGHDGREVGHDGRAVGEEDSVFLKTEGEFRKVGLGDIVCVEGMKDYVLVYLVGEKQPLVVHATMKAMEEMLPAERFMRVHRSAIVALGQIKSVSPGGDIVVGDRFLHVSEGYREAFEAYLNRRLLK